MLKAIRSLATDKHRLILVLVTVLVFGNILWNGYNMDDNLVTRNHPLTSKGIVSLKKIFTQSYYSNTADITFGYRPMVLASFAIEHQFFGQHAWVSHAINLLIYLLTILILYGVFKLHLSHVHKLFAFLAMLLFAVHPLHTEVVASIKNRDELLALLFGALAFKKLFQYADNYKILNLLLASLFLIFGLLSKKTVLPLIYILPIGLVLLSSMPIKRVFIVLVVFSFPSIIVASDLLIKQFLLLLLPMVACMLFILFYLNQNWASIFKHTYAFVFYSFAFFLLAIVERELVYVLISLFIALIVLYKDMYIGVSLIMILSSISAWSLGLLSVSKYPAFLGIGYITIALIQKQFHYKQIIPAIISILLISIQYPHLSTVALLVGILAMFYLLNKYPVWAYVYITCYIIALVFVFHNYEYSLFLAVTSVLYFIFQKSNSAPISQLKSVAITIVVVPFMFALFNLDSPTKLWNYIAVQKTLNDNKSTFNEQLIYNQQAIGKSESRQLHYVENTLVGSVSPQEKIATGWLTLYEYGKLMIWPVKQSFYYGYAIIERVHLNDYRVWVSMFAHVLLILLALTVFKKQRLFLWASMWYLISIILFSNWPVLIAGMVADRLAYVASLGFSMIIPLVFFRFCPNFKLQNLRLTEYCYLSILLVFSYFTTTRNMLWKSPITLMEHDLMHLQNSVMANSIYANHLMYESATNKELTPAQSNELQLRAISAYQQANSVYPFFFNNHFELSRIFVYLQRFEEAKQSLNQALKIDSNNIFALESMAKVCFELKLQEETEKYANRYLILEPQNENVHEILTYIFLINGQFDKAKQYASRGLQFFPNSIMLQRMYQDASNNNAVTPE
jgi:tetratricopeptide (TPR) repeat protein